MGKHCLRALKGSDVAFVGYTKRSLPLPSGGTLTIATSMSMSMEKCDGDVGSRAHDMC